MGIYVIRVPDIGEGIAEVELVTWNVQPGDSVSEDQHLADVMTDKATVEVPSPVHGKVISLGGAVGQVMAVGAELVRLEVEGEGNLKDSPPLPPLGEGRDGGRPAVGAVAGKASAAGPHPNPGAGGETPPLFRLSGSTQVGPEPQPSAPEGRGRPVAPVLLPLPLGFCMHTSF